MSRANLPSLTSIVRHATLGTVLLTMLVYQLYILDAVAPAEVAGLYEVTMVAILCGMLYAILPYVSAAGTILFWKVAGLYERHAGGDLT